MEKFTKKKGFTELKTFEKMFDSFGVKYEVKYPDKYSPDERDLNGFIFLNLDGFSISFNELGGFISIMTR